MVPAYPRELTWELQGEAVEDIQAGRACSETPGTEIPKVPFQPCLLTSKKLVVPRPGPTHSSRIPQPLLGPWDSHLQPLCFLLQQVPVPYPSLLLINI